ncbi:MAG: PilN domain-containing protein [Bdellovibrionales bacterium]|nr:PilN domain-containing protein [Bdellovibrionales bacterium]
MIKINLLGEEGPRDTSGILWIAGFVGVLVLFFAVSAFLYIDVTSKLSVAQQEKEDLERQLAQIQKTTKEVRELEKKQQDLNAKLAVIARLKLSKMGPVRVMDDLNSSIPERSWLTNVRERSNLMTLEGFALDNQTVATFMRDLEDSDYFSAVELDESKTEEQRNVRIQRFRLRSKVNYAGKIEDSADKADSGDKK